MKTSGRNEKTRVKTAKGRKMGSKLWLERQLNDPFVRQAKVDGYRSRAVYKLIEIQEKTHILHKGLRIMDLGAAPGSWSQYAVKMGCLVTAIDLQEIEPIPYVRIIQGDFLADSVLPEINGKYDVVLSDMAAASSGYHNTDHLRIMELCEASLQFCLENLAPGGAFATKMLQGGEEQKFAADLRTYFEKVKFVKPEASRKDSSETFIVAMGFKQL